MEGNFSFSLPNEIHKQNHPVIQEPLSLFITLISIPLFPCLHLLTLGVCALEGFHSDSLDFESTALLAKPSTASNRKCFMLMLHL